MTDVDFSQWFVGKSLSTDWTSRFFPIWAPLLAVPPLVLSLHLAYSTRIRTRTEQQAWQRLARTTDALNVVDLDEVLTTAVTQAAELFSADEVEIELRGTERMVRGTAAGIGYDGVAAEPSQVTGTVIPVALEGHDRSIDLGVLRLRFTGPVALSEREQYTLRTFASALCGAGSARCASTWRWRPARWPR